MRSEMYYMYVTIKEAKKVLKLNTERTYHQTCVVRHKNILSGKMKPDCLKKYQSVYSTLNNLDPRTSPTFRMWKKCLNNCRSQNTQTLFVTVPFTYLYYVGCVLKHPVYVLFASYVYKRQMIATSKCILLISPQKLTKYKYKVKTKS